PGTDVTLIAYGAMMKEVRAAGHLLAERGIDAEVLDLRSLVPLDSDAIIESVTRTGRAVVVHEAHRTAGFGAEIIAQIQEKALYSLLAPIERVTGWDIVVPLRRAESHYMPTVDSIVTAAERTMRS
ncbi:MAG: alpha-ketoacid dehydrogenase subunit beta, partial [Acidimicrobiia bacterium]|nr:alpha-ketoacid dehydrogenase subunit beta [Acidimicrobiia bacterium]